MEVDKRTLYDCIGDRFERILATQFPELRKNTERSNLPDFSNGTFHIETKAGFIDYGAQIKEYQVAGFSNLSLPVIYAIGFHNLRGTKTLCQGMSPALIDEYLEQNMGVDLAYLVSNSIIQKMWNKNKKISEKNSDWEYFSLKPRHLDAIILNKQFERAGRIWMPSKYYRIKRADLTLIPAPKLYGTTKTLQFGAILEQRDLAVLDFLRKHNNL